MTFLKKNLKMKLQSFSNSVCIDYKSSSLNEVIAFSSKSNCKKRSLLTIALLLIFMALSFSGFGRTGVNEEWQLHSKVDGVEIYFVISSCNDHDVVFLKFINTNSTNKTITWEEEFWTANIHVPNHPQGRKTLTLNPGEVSESDCLKITSRECITLSYQLENSVNKKILRYNIYNISITN